MRPIRCSERCRRRSTGFSFRPARPGWKSGRTAGSRPNSGRSRAPFPIRPASGSARRNMNCPVTPGRSRSTPIWNMTASTAGAKCRWTASFRSATTSSSSGGASTSHRSSGVTFWCSPPTGWRQTAGSSPTRAAFSTSSGWSDCRETRCGSSTTTWKSDRKAQRSFCRLKNSIPGLRNFTAAEAATMATSTTWAGFSRFRAANTPSPPDHYFMLGDNSEFSLDSRFFGPVPRRNLVGKAWLVFWPFSRRWGIADRQGPVDAPTGESRRGTFPVMYRQ